MRVVPLLSQLQLEINNKHDTVMTHLLFLSALHVIVQYFGVRYNLQIGNVYLRKYTLGKRLASFE